MTIAPPKQRHPGIRCSFCGKGTSQVAKLITGPSVHICNECVEMCNEILREDKAGVPDDLALDTLAAPHEIKEYLDKFIIGQEQAKIGVSVAAYNHFKRILSRRERAVDEADDVEIEKSNILLLGSTGTGKTLIAQTLAKMLRVPFTIVDATVYTEAGYVGEDVENMLVRLLQVAHHDLAKAEKGIIYIDEIDKVARKSPNPSITRDVSGEGVQQALLKILEGTIANIPPKGGRKHPEQNLIQMNTRDILFICGGAFVGIEDIIRARIGKTRMGFTGDLHAKEELPNGELLRKCEPDDLIKYGLIPELVGRLPAVFGLDELDEVALMRILKEPKNALTRQYKKLFAMEGVRLVFAPDALHQVVSTAVRKKTGARGLRAVLENALVPVMYEIPSNKDIGEVMITKEVIRGNGEPVYSYRKQERKIA
jgi:ATP-dependent Clp protease ATP-binding subunit ClpX